MAFFLLIGSTSYAQPYRPADYRQLQVELMDILDDLRWIERQIEPIRQKAAKHEEVLSLQALCEKKTLQAMVDLAPKHEAAILRWKELTQELQASPERSKPPHEQSRRYRDDINELNRLRENITPVFDEAMLKPEVRECRRTLKQKELEVMVAIEPRVEDWLLREETLNEAFRRLQERVEEGR